MHRIKHLCSASPQEETDITASHLLIFNLDDQRYALPLAGVQRVIRAAAPTLLPQAPEIVVGILDLQGTVVPVVDVRRRFGMPQREIRPEDQFIVARARSLNVALVVDGTEGVIEDDPELCVAPERIVPGMEHVSGVTRTVAGLVLIHDLSRFLSLEEEDSLREALASAPG
ncbi:chemotaxis protein CheW [Geomesophilobacter sediminis]|uniref:chemotaxis protein CheW n=1 Tax=Geomesophilobacter sediminis TaxID=2798584 RepID=UPI001F44F399|nr:chemotaxis protein CheW [Geomesophilobacter sediminis]